VFRIGNATNNVSWETYERIAAMDEVAWTIPISLGDSHRGFRVMGTTQGYFEHYRYGDEKPLTLDDGRPFTDVYDAVLGADVARSLGYALGDEIILSHGLVSAEFADHDDKPFTVVGVLDKTGTPVDRTVHVSLAGIEAIHIDWQGGSRSPVTLDAEQVLKFDLTPTSITAFMVGLDNRALTFRLQRQINDDPAEPLTAIIPGVTLAEFWRTISAVEQVLLVISALVLVAGLLGMLTTILSTLNERRREIAVLRAVGARASQVVELIVLETLLVVVAGCVLGVGSLYGLLTVARPIVARRFGVDLALSRLDQDQLLILAGVVGLAACVGLIPGFVAYRRSIQDGLDMKV
jgi:putative ABC transport system permease protein